MKKRNRILPIVALLGVVLPLASCNTSNLPNDEDNKNPNPDIGQPDDNNDSEGNDDESSKPLKVKLSAEKTDLDLNEMVKLTIDVENNSENKAVTVISNHPEIISIVKENNETYAKAIAKGYASVTVTVGNVSSSLDFTAQKFYSHGLDSYNEVMAKLNNAMTYEKSHLKSGEYHQSTQKGLSNPNTNDYTFEVYQGNKIKVSQSYRAAGTYFKDTTTYYGLSNDCLVIYQYSEEDEELAITDSTISLKIGVDISEEDALAYTSGVDLHASANTNKVGVIKEAVNYNISNYSKANDKETYVLKSIVDGVMTLTGHTTNYTQYKEFNLDYVINDEGALTSYKFSENIYGLVDDPNNPGQKTKGSQTNTNIYSAKFDYSPRTVGEDFINLDSLFYTDYEFCMIDPGDTGIFTPISECEVGQLLNLHVIGGAPTTATPLVDKIAIKSVSPAENAVIGEDGSLFPLAPGELTITASSGGGIEKSITINITGEAVGPDVNTVDKVMKKLTTGTYIRSSGAHPNDKFEFIKTSPSNGTFTIVLGDVNVSFTGSFEVEMDHEGTINIWTDNVVSEGTLHCIGGMWGETGQDFNNIEIIVSYGSVSQKTINFIKQ